MSYALTDNYDSEDGRSVSKPMSNEKINDFIENALKDNEKVKPLPASFTAGKRSSFNIGNFDENSKLITDIHTEYGRLLDGVGLNFVDPIQAYSTRFNKNMQTLGLDPQRPGKSYTFFTRPDLNISNETANKMPFLKFILNSEIGNLVCDRLTYPSFNTAPPTADELGKETNVYKDSAITLDPKFRCLSVFDPFLTNTCKELSGIKDMSMEKYETEGDFAGHTLTYAMGSDGWDSVNELSATFTDTSLCPNFLKHYIWFQYIHEVCKGNINPKMKYIRERIIDYTCSIYTFKLAEDDKTILRWSKSTGCFPISLSLNTVNHSNELKLDEFDDVSVTYASNFTEVMNPRILADFNYLTYPKAFKNFDNVKVFGALKANDDKLDFKFELNEFDDGNLPDKIIPSEFDQFQSVDKEGKITTVNDRQTSMWSTTPIVYGNKLIFV